MDVAAEAGEIRRNKVNLVLAHCPIFLPETLTAVPEAKIYEIYLGYIAASLGPLKKDTVRFNGVTKSEKPERYAMPGVFGADWERFRDIIVNYSNMGWPNYQEILYGIDHKEAVANIILSDLFARASYTPEEYDNGTVEMLGGVCRFYRRCVQIRVHTENSETFCKIRPIRAILSKAFGFRLPAGSFFYGQERRTGGARLEAGE